MGEGIAGGHPALLEAVLASAGSAEAHQIEWRQAIYLASLAKRLDCGGKRSATPLSEQPLSHRTRLAMPKRRRRSALPAHSKRFARYRDAWQT
jgi:hypothetical protein